MTDWVCHGLLIQHYDIVDGIVGASSTNDNFTPVTVMSLDMNNTTHILWGFGRANKRFNLRPHALNLVHPTLTPKSFVTLYSIPIEVALRRARTGMNIFLGTDVQNNAFDTHLIETVQEICSVSFKKREDKQNNNILTLKP